MVCIFLCHGRPFVTKRASRTNYQCIQCGIPLCIVVRNHPYDNVGPRVEGMLTFTSCWNLWHNSAYTIPVVDRNTTGVVAGGDDNDDDDDDDDA